MPARGSLKLLDDPTAVRLFGSTALARLPYNAKDGTPRVVLMLFAWPGQEVFFGTYPGSAKLAARANPDVAITIDTPGPPPEVLLLQGRAKLGPVGDIVDEYAAAHRRSYGELQGRTNIQEMVSAGIRMVRIAVQPTWVGALDCRTRVPGGMS
ncbi:MAG: pyridoxamine 5'-phosphate oxidase family protein [Dermatophilaceae bacterium]